MRIGPCSSMPVTKYLDPAKMDHPLMFLDVVQIFSGVRGLGQGPKARRLGLDGRSKIILWGSRYYYQTGLLIVEHISWGATSFLILLINLGNLFGLCSINTAQAIDGNLTTAWVSCWVPISF